MQSEKMVNKTEHVRTGGECWSNTHNWNSISRRKREETVEMVEEIKAKIFPKLVIDTKPQIQETQGTSSSFF